MIQLIKKYSVLIGVVISSLLMLIAILLYPGGSMVDENSVGFDWTKNFISNLFGSWALNGTPNPSQIWAYAAMILLPCSYAIFFVNMAKKMPEKNAATILKYGGIANIIFTFLTTVPNLHDLMLILSTSFLWTCLVVITVYILKTKLQLFKFFCVISILIFYYSIYLWGTSNWDLLPLMQKINFITSTSLILALEYFTGKEDFAHIKARTRKNLVKAI